jgi:hypothetical protein
MIIEQMISQNEVHRLKNLQQRETVEKISIYRLYKMKNYRVCWLKVQRSIYDKFESRSNNDYSDRNVSWVSSDLRENSGIAPETRPPLLRSVVFPIYYSVVILTFNDTESVVKELRARYEKLQSRLA